MSSKLPTLAVEIVQLLAGTLEPTDLFSVRLVCRTLNRKTLHYFALTYFATVRTDLTPKSLQRLQNISESDHLAQYVKALHIKHVDGTLGRGFQWHRHPSGYLAAPVVDADLLRDILVNKLVRCRSFRIDGYDEVQQRDETDFLIPGDAVEIVLSIVAEANLAIRSFTIESEKGSTSRLDTKRLQMPLCRRPQFIAAWAHLEELVLDYTMTYDQHDWALDLVSYAPRIRILSLRFYSEYPDSICSFMERLTSAHPFSGLQDFSLGSAYVTVEIISKFLLENRDTLHALSFRHVTIEDGGTWATVLEGMKGNLPCLESLSIFWLKEHRSEEWSRIIFSKLAKNPAVPGSEERKPSNGRLKSDSRLVKSLERPVKLTYRWLRGEERVLSASYMGPGMDNFLDVLVETAETL